MLDLRGIGYRHPTAEVAAVRDVNLRVNPGELVLLTGPTGCGKSTLLRLAAGLLQRHGRGEVRGHVSIDGLDPATASPSARVRLVALVGQDPDDQRVAATVGDEIAFAAESAGFDEPAIDRAVADAIRDLGLPGGSERQVAALSSGQRQRLSVAAALSGGAVVLLLDEPLAHLDPQGAIELVERLRALADGGRAVVVVEHRLGDLWRVADRCVVMENGVVVADGPPAAPAERSDCAGGEVTCGDVILTATNLALRHPNGEGIHGVSFSVRGGERVAVIGPNGAGKSTLLAVLAGESATQPLVGGRVVSVPQNPDLGLFCPTVREELAYAPLELGFADVAARVERLADAFSLGGLLDRPPQSLSRGQRLRVAVAAAVAADPAVLLLDEPTAGQDPVQVERLMLAVSATLREGVLIFATHDIPLARRHATRVLALEGGRVIGDGSPAVTLPPESAPRLPTDPSAQPSVGAQKKAGSLIDPRTRLALVGLVGVLAVSLESPRSLLVLAALTALAFARFSPSRRTALGAAGVLVAIVWSTVLSQGIFYGDEPRVALASVGPLSLWREGVAHGLSQSLRFCAMTLAGFALAASTPPERLFAGLRSLKVPFGLSFLVVTALRFVPDVAGEWVAVRVARSRRGRPAWRRAPWGWLSLEASLLSPLLARTLRRARALAESLDARGFDAASPRAVRRPLTFGGLDGAVLVGAALVAFCVVALRLVFVLYTSDTWYHPSLRNLYALARDL